MGIAIDNAVKKLIKITSSKNIDWDLFDQILLGLDDINAFDEKYDETILTEYLTDGDFLDRGAAMVEAVRHFINCGYDVSANNGKNGCLALSSLCWSSYDIHILEAAKVLLNAGAPVECVSENSVYDESEGVLESISWKLSGVWTIDKDYKFGNILEAYYAVVQAKDSGKDYNMIECYSDCIGRTIASVLSISSDSEEILKNENDINTFVDPLVIYFDEKPLVISPYVDFVINPLYINENKEKLINVNASFENLIGAKLEKIEYIFSTICSFKFNNGYQLLLASSQIGKSEDRKRVGKCKIVPIEDAPDIYDIDINCICGVCGYIYADTVTHYDENPIALFGDEKSYILNMIPGKNDKHQLVLFPCDKDMLFEFTRQYPLGKPNNIKCYYENDEITAMRFDYEDKYLYFKTQEFPEIEVVLSDNDFNPSESYSLHSHKGQHIDFLKRSL